MKTVIIFVNNYDKLYLHNLKPAKDVKVCMFRFMWFDHTVAAEPILMKLKINRDHGLSWMTWNIINLCYVLSMYNASEAAG